MRNLSRSFYVHYRLAANAGIILAIDGDAASGMSELSQMDQSLPLFQQSSQGAVGKTPPAVKATVRLTTNLLNINLFTPDTSCTGFRKSRNQRDLATRRRIGSRLFQPKRHPTNSTHIRWPQNVSRRNVEADGRLPVSQRTARLST